MALQMTNHSHNSKIYTHERLPLILTDEFDFYRCIKFDDSLYGKTVSELHAGNLRVSRKDNRYSNLFVGQKLSYWADSPETARAEAKKWGSGNNLLTFWAYDDGSSYVPTVYPPQKLQIIDGTQIEFNKILKKLDHNEPLSREERNLIDDIAYEEPDCLAYDSEARKGGVNYLFFEHGFRKLSLREVRLNLGNLKGRNHTKIECAYSSSYIPYIQRYAACFKPIAKIGIDISYYKSDEFKLKFDVFMDQYERIKEEHNA